MVDIRSTYRESHHFFHIPILCVLYEETYTLVPTNDNIHEMK